MRLQQWPNIFDIPWFEVNSDLYTIINDIIVKIDVFSRVIISKKRRPSTMIGIAHTSPVEIYMYCIIIIFEVTEVSLFNSIFCGLFIAAGHCVVCVVR